SRNDQVAKSVIRLVKRAHGHVYSLADLHFEKALADISAIVSELMQYYTDFLVEDSTIDPATLNVQIDSATLARDGFDYNADEVEVELTSTQGLHPNSSVVIN